MRPEDKPLLVDGLRRMSPESRFMRFFAHRDRLSPRELAYLTEVDHDRHVAIGAITRGPDGHPKGLGVARFIRLDPPEIAEAAVTVVDDAQGRGLGRVLFQYLVAAAHERGVREFRFDVLAENESMLKLVEHLFPGSTSHIEDGIVTIDCPLPVLDEAGQTPDAMLYRVLRLAAEGALRVYRSLRGQGTNNLLKGSDVPADFGVTEDDVPGPSSWGAGRRQD
ncbi:MAG: GNAT family N-acetyltransferase [Myxococcota bacterium]